MYFKIFYDNLAMGFLQKKMELFRKNQISAWCKKIWEIFLLPLFPKKGKNFLRENIQELKTSLLRFDSREKLWKVRELRKSFKEEKFKKEKF